MAPRDPSVRCWKFAEWPVADQVAWTSGCTPGDPFDDPSPGATLRQESLNKICKGYGRWLCFLASRDWLDPHRPALERITRRRLRAYFHALKAAGNADYTIIGRFAELTMAMKILAPGSDVSWIRRPDGVSIYALLPKQRRPMLAPDSGVLLDWAVEMMDTARAEQGTGRWLTDYRDGLLLAMLASRGRRLRSMALLRLAHELLEEGEHYRIELTREQVKTNRPDRFSLPEHLSPYIRYYWDVVRPALAKERISDAFWVNRSGRPWTKKAIQTQVLERTRSRFGQAFGPHRFRHALSTTAALHDPGYPGLAAGALGISAQTVERSYNLAGQSAAISKLASLNEARRRQFSGHDAKRTLAGARDRAQPAKPARGGT